MIENITPRRIEIERSETGQILHLKSEMPKSWNFGISNGMDWKFQHSKIPRFGHSGFEVQDSSNLGFPILSRCMRLVVILIYGWFLVSCKPEEPRTSAPEKVNSFVGSARCAECHPNEAERWSHSWHARALAP